MYRYGRRIYFDGDGKIILELGEIETNSENYYEHNDPREWHPDLIGKSGIEMQQFELGEYATEFSTQKLARIDPQTRRPVFEDRPASPADPAPPKGSIEEEVASLKQQIQEMQIAYSRQ